ncbi:YciI family protein [Nitrosospira sp. Nsp13]|uniref:YciI family protein n=1 Tax=Nitrosospira sp. Nsp13 TaxID=1855332 RepID=UPI001C31BA09|nr:YciI family protein [Nitrosospira sp. Nsp13]
MAVTDDPFIESKEVVGGYWMIEVKSKQDAIDQVFEMSDIPAEVQQAGQGRYN